jgi:hypothetical protein
MIAAMPAAMMFVAIDRRDAAALRDGNYRKAGRAGESGKQHQGPDHAAAGGQWVSGTEKSRSKKTP